MGNAPERDYVIDIDPFGDSALDESDIDGKRRIDEPLEVLARPIGWKDLQPYPACREYVTVSLGIHLENAPLGPLVIVRTLGGAE